jgi:hypothetical protein
MTYAKTGPTRGIPGHVLNTAVIVKKMNLDLELKTSKNELNEPFLSVYSKK